MEARTRGKWQFAAIRAMEMIVDWLSFTLPYPHLTDNVTYLQWLAAIESAVDKLHQLVPGFATISSNWNDTTAQRPYTNAVMCGATGVRLNVAKYRKECLVVANGEACDRLTDAGLIGAFVALAASTGTRLDIAHDIKTSVLPSKIAAAGWSSRITSTSQVQSSTGETVYVGSRSSTMMCRIYRYFPPHPRNHLLRFEFETKGEQARATAQQIAAEGLHAVGRGIAKRFDFQSPMAKEWFAGKSVTVRTEPHKRIMAKTEIWLLKQASPAFKKLVIAGVIEDPHEWLQKHFLGGLHEKIEG